ncbi:MAG: hypothetical protein ACPHCN_07235 [Mycobacterium sp.]
MNWDVVAPFIEDAIARSGGGHTLADVKRRVEDGSNTTHIWPGKKSAAVTEIAWEGTKPVLNCWLAGGDLEELREMIQAAEVFAERIGCHSVQVSGRKGWVRALRDLGYKPVAYTVEKELRDG